MNKPLLVLLRKFSSVCYIRYANQTHGNLIQLASIWAPSSKCVCTNAHQNAVQKSNNQEHESSKLKKKAKRARKKQLLNGVGSILADPGVPDPQKMQQSDLVDWQTKSFVQAQDNIIAINKPPGLPISGGQRSDDEVTFISLLPEVAEAIGHPSAEIVTGPEREASGLLLLGHNKASAGELSQALSAAKKSKQLLRRYWAIILGIPAQEQGIINETIGYEKIGDQVLGIIRHDASKASFKKKKVPDWKPSKRTETNKKAETHYQVISSNEELNCALVELKTHYACKHQLQVHLAHKLHPILGDHIYSSRIGKLLGVPVPLNPHGVRPATQEIGPQLKQALLLRSGLLHMLPLHLHWYDITLPKWKGNKNVCIRVPPPDYFWKTLQLLNLSPPLLQES